MKTNSSSPAVESGRDSWDPYADRYGKPLFSSLWSRAWGHQYPQSVGSYSSCTWQLLGQLVGELALSPGSVVADLGCGAGGVGLWLARALDARLVGVDRSECGIRIARSRASTWLPEGRCLFVCREFSDTGLRAGSVDAVISVDALPFAEDIDAALAEVRRILKPRAPLLFTTRDSDEQSRRGRELGPAWESALRRNGLALERAIVRPEVGQLWGVLHAAWIEHESELREELSPRTVDLMMEQARAEEPQGRADRPWLLVVARKEAPLE